MTNGNEPINAVLDQSASLQNETSLGLTKREHMAIEFTKAILCSQSGHRAISKDLIKRVVIEALTASDELIRQLNSEGK